MPFLSCPHKLFPWIIICCFDISIFFSLQLVLQLKRSILLWVHAHLLRPSIICLCLNYYWVTCSLLNCALQVIMLAPIQFPNSSERLDTNGSIQYTPVPFLQNYFWSSGSYMVESWWKIDDSAGFKIKKWHSGLIKSMRYYMLYADSLGFRTCISTYCDFIKKLLISKVYIYTHTHI